MVELSLIVEASKENFNGYWSVGSLFKMSGSVTFARGAS